MPRKLDRRQFLRSSLVVGASLSLSGAGLARLNAQDATPENTAEGSAAMGLPLTGQLRQVHDPVLIKADDAYYVFCTGNGIPVRRSEDLLDWKVSFPPSVFAHVPDWALEMIPGATNIWAPDISFYNGKYHLYYSVSTFGSNRSVIGLATNTTLNGRDDAYEWVDEELVIESPGGGTYNCIDPNLILDADGVPWLAFGSFWSGIKMRRLDFDTGKLSAEDDTLYSLSQRFVNSGSVEGAFIIRKDDWYYLFVSFDNCCRGVDSTYRVMVGRSENLTGPYADRDGVAMLDGGGTQVTFPTERWRGPGHNGILQENGSEYIVYHAYDAENGQGTPTLHIDPLVWDADGWPEPVYPSPEASS
ncbi:MAG: family 43 glycosylhydrolase [Chloroflexota bacterium]